MESGLDIVSLPSHTSHALQPLDIACFKPFQTTFKQIRNAWCLTNKNQPIEKQTLCDWTSTALKRALTSTNIRAGFRRASIWPLDREASKSSMAPSTRFEEGLAGPKSCGVTSVGNHGEGGVTCLIGHPHAANRMVTLCQQMSMAPACMLRRLIRLAQTSIAKGATSTLPAKAPPWKRKAHWMHRTPPPSNKWCTMVCTTTLMSQTVRRAPTRHTIEMCK